MNGWHHRDLRPSDSTMGSDAGEVRTFGKVVARSPEMHQLFDVLERFARSDVTVTMIGETGSGKDVLAHALHARSTRANGPLVVFDCGSVAANLAESELLGHERGSFTGAVAPHEGVFERANGGTLFLDEIAELPLELQPCLLRALESRCVRRVGGKVDRPFDMRVIAATHRSLRAEVAAGRFREDLFFRLAVAVVEVPPLRRRLQELPDIAKGILTSLGYGHLRVSEAALELLRSHSWPGNIRELKNCLSCALAFVDVGATVLEPGHLKMLSARSSEEVETAWVDDLPLAGHPLDRIERAAIQQTLRQAAGNKAQAARILGIAVSTLYQKLKRFRIEEPGSER
jgi:two-component system response regulator HydG